MRTILRHALLFMLLVSGGISARGQQTLLIEGFESWPPAGWSSYTLGAGNGWIRSWQGPQVAHSGSYAAYPSISNQNVNDWLVSPSISIAQANYELVFWELFGDTTNYVLSEVLVSTGSPVPSDGDFSSVYTTTDTATTYSMITVDLAAYAGQDVYVAFHYTGTYHTWFVDDVAVGPAGFSDVRPTTFLSPAPVSNAPGNADIEIEVANIGLQVVDSIWVDRSIDGVPQPVAGFGGLNLMPNSTTSLALGSYLFPAYGSYSIEVVVHSAGDIDPTNDTLSMTYDVAPYQDAALDRLYPEGYAGLPGMRTMSLVLNNKGDSVIQDVLVNWSVDGMVQPPALITGAGIQGGNSDELAFGSYAFPARGVYLVEADIEVLGDTGFFDNSYKAYVAVDTLWESFEGYSFPPQGWSSEFGVRDDINFDTPPQGIRYYVGFSDNNFFGPVTDTLYTPLLDIAAGNDVINFRIKKNAFYPATVSVVWKDGQTGVVSTIQTVTPPTDIWAPVSVNISAASGINRIGIVVASSGPGEAKLDLITSTARPHAFPQDLALIEPEIWPVAAVGPNNVFPVRVKNEGQSLAMGSDYSIALFRADGSQLATLPGVDLDPREETTLLLPSSFAFVELMKVYLEIQYPMDDNAANDRSEEWLLHVLPADAAPDAMGSAESINLNFPMDGGGDTWTFAKDDLSQTRVLASDLDGAGMLYGMYFTYRNILSSEGDYPLQVRMDQPAVVDLDSGWQDMAQAMVVFDDTVHIHQSVEDQVLYIPFTQPLLLTGVNDLVFQLYQFDGPWPPTQPRFMAFATDPNGPVRTRSLMNSLYVDPVTPPPFGSPWTAATYTVLLKSPINEVGTVQGLVTDVNSAPIAGAIVSVAGTPLRDTTDASGSYAITGVPYADISLHAVAFGYNDTTELVAVFAPVTVADLVMSERPTLSLNGVVTGNDAPAVPLENVLVAYSGYADGDTLSAIDGQFLLSGLPGEASYTLRLSMRGYRDSTLLLDLEDLSLDLDTIVLVQDLLAAHDVRVADQGTEAQVTWRDPRLSREMLWAVDLDDCTFSYTNEPLEDVYLGNRFTIADTMTLTHAEVRFDVYPNAIDLVTIAILDANEEVLVESEPFLSPTDSTFIVDLPNIMVDDDVFVMLHWQNNPLSTNALCIDRTPGLDDRAYIKYPGQPAQLLSTFLSADPGAFHLRLGILENDTPLTSAPAPVYNVYRGHADSIAFPSSWVAVNGVPVNGLQEQDINWATLPLAPYRYAVEALHATGISEWTISLPIQRSFVGVEEDVIFQYVTVYPNPATTHLNLRFELDRATRVEVTLLDPLGRVVAPLQRFESAQVNATLDVAGLASGNYQLQIRVNDTLYSRQVMLMGGR